MTCCPLSAHVNMHCSPTCLFGRPFLFRIFYLHESTDAPVRIDPKRPSQHLQSGRDLLGCTWALQPEFRTEDFTGLPKKRWKLLMCSRRFGVWINSSSLHSGKICSPTCRVLSSCQVMIYGDQQTIWSLQQEEEVSTGWNWTYKRKRKKKKLRICFPSFSSKEASCCWGRRHSLCWTALLCERRLERQQTGASINTMNPTQTATSSKRIISKDFGTHEGIGATSLNWRKRPLSDEVRPESKCVGAVSDKAPSKWIDCRCRRIAFSLPSLPSFE